MVSLKYQVIKIQIERREKQLFCNFKACGMACAENCKWIAVRMPNYIKKGWPKNFFFFGRITDEPVPRINDLSAILILKPAIITSVSTDYYFSFYCCQHTGNGITVICTMSLL